MKRPSLRCRGTGRFGTGALRDLIAERRLHINFPAELRFVAADDGWLSPMSGRDSDRLGPTSAGHAQRERALLRHSPTACAAFRLGHTGANSSTFRADYLRTVYPDFARF